MKIKVIICFCLFLFSGALSAETIMGVAEIKNQTKQDIQVVGEAKLEDVIAKTINVTGPLSFKNLTAQNSTNITGPMKGKKGTFSDINVTGSVDLKELTYKTLTAVGEVELKETTALGKTDVTGLLEMEKCTAQDIYVTSEEIKLKDTTTNNIVIRKNDGSVKIQELHLKDKCVIKGDITFEAGKGLVKMGSDVQHSGTIKGAQVKKS